MFQSSPCGVWANKRAFSHCNSSKLVQNTQTQIYLWNQINISINSRLVSHKLSSLPSIHRANHAGVSRKQPKPAYGQLCQVTCCTMLGEFSHKPLPLPRVLRPLPRVHRADHAGITIENNLSPLASKYIRSHVAQCCVGFHINYRPCQEFMGPFQEFMEQTMPALEQKTTRACLWASTPGHMLNCDHSRVDANVVLLPKIYICLGV